MRIRSGRGRAWYVTDCILKLPEPPSHPVPHLVFKLSGSAPGLRFNTIAPLFMVKDKPALKRWLAAEFERDRPRWLIPAHGDVVDLEACAALARALFA